MSEREKPDQRDKASKRARLQALLFSGAALGTTLVMLTGPKLPPYKGD